MKKPESAISSLVKLRSYYQSQYEHYLAKATASKENRERVSLLLQDLSDSEMIKEAFWEGSYEAERENSRLVGEKVKIVLDSRPSNGEEEEYEDRFDTIGDTHQEIEALFAFNRALEIIGSVSSKESGKTLHLKYFQKLLEQEMSRPIDLKIVELYLEEAIVRGYLERDRFDSNCYKPYGTIPKNNKGEKVESRKSQKSSEGLSGNLAVAFKEEERETEKGEENSSSTRSYAYNLPPSPKLKATLLETVQQYMKSETPRRFSIKNVINYLYSTAEQQSWSRERKNKVSSCISNVLSRKSYLNKKWKRIKPGMYQPMSQK